MIYTSITQLIGGTPLLRLSGYEQAVSATGRIIGKLEYFNPSGSVKDRVALAMIEDAERSGLIKSGTTIIEPTSGNTGIGLAAVAAARGYRLILTMPETMSSERRSLLKAYGAELVLTEGSRGMAGAIEKANQLNRQIQNSVVLGQFTNPSNPTAHRTTTAPEIWQATEGKVDYLVCGVGTGGTISGIGEYLRSKNPDIKIVAVEPKDSAVLSGDKAGAHEIQGIGAGFVPQTLNTDIYNEVIMVSGDNAIQAAQSLAKTDGLLVGISSGAALWAAAQVAVRQEATNKNVIVVLPDTGERYISTRLFN